MKIEFPFCSQTIFYFFWSQAFINGSMNWVAYCRSNTHINFAYDTSGMPACKFQCLIMLFDMGDEIFREMTTLPESLMCESPMSMYALVTTDS